MRRLLFLLLFCGAGLSLWAQSLSLEFTSQTEAKFFFYLNGKLLNQRSTGHIVIPNLDDSKQHLRIVVDDPYSVALTKTIRPSAKRPEYELTFNAVRERILIRKAKAQRPDRPSQQESFDSQQEQPDKMEWRREHDSHTRPALKDKYKRDVDDPDADGTTGKEIKTNKF